MSQALATILWLPHTRHHGRNSPPPGPTYIAPACFIAYAAGPPRSTPDILAAASPEQARWSLRVERTDAAAADHWQALVSFIAADAPHDLLTPTSSTARTAFVLYEGRRAVAVGHIG